MNNLSPNLAYLVACIASMLISAFSIPKIALIAQAKKLVDHPDNHRKIHKEMVPNLGGIGIFLVYVIIASLFIRAQEFAYWNYMIAGSLILFIIGVKDDIITLTPSKKFLAQIAAAIILVYFGDVRLTSLHGVFGVYSMPYWTSVGFSIIGCIFVTNAFNLIDGVDGLAGTIGALCTFILGISLAMLGKYNEAVIAFSLTGAILGFLWFNVAPARIFMGDGGALTIGFTISILSIFVVNSFNASSSFADIVHSESAALIFCLSVIFIPIFDSFRVFVTRIAKGHHPFRGDKTHLHHFLLDLGFSHTRVVAILVTANLLIISVLLLVQDFNPNIALAAVFGIGLGLFAILYFMRRTRLAKLAKTATPSESIKYGQDILKVKPPKVEIETSVPS